jgi:hypothetical protein
MPFFIGDMDLLASDLRNWNVKGEIISVFHGDAAYLLLNDDSYNANRHSQTGIQLKPRKAHRRVDAARCANRAVRAPPRQPLDQ